MSSAPTPTQTQTPTQAQTLTPTLTEAQTPQPSDETTRSESVPSSSQQSKSDYDVMPALTQLGILLGPATVAALVCQLLNISSQSTAAVSLVILTLAAIFIYRKEINLRVSAAWLVAGMVILIGGFFLEYQDILLKDTGLIKRYTHANDFLVSADLGKFIDQTQKEIWFVGTDFNITAGQQRDVLLHKLASGVKINFLIFDPHHPHLEELAQDFGQTPAELKAECDKSLQSLIALQAAWKQQSASSSNPGELNIRVFKAHPHGRFYVFDPDSKKGRTYFVPYVNSVDSTQIPGFLLANVQTGIFKPYFAAIKKLWEQAEPLDNLPKAQNAVASDAQD